MNVAGKPTAHRAEGEGASRHDKGSPPYRLEHTTSRSLKIFQRIKLLRMRGNVGANVGNNSEVELKGLS